MKIYLVSLFAGVLVGVVYGLISVRSPAPPVVALIGLMGMLLGEQVLPLAKRLMSEQQVSVGWVRERCGEHIFGQLPSNTPPSPSRAAGGVHDA